ncbi:hypothetical protein D3C84_857940 [compost metagenome]
MFAAVTVYILFSLVLLVFCFVFELLFYEFEVQFSVFPRTRTNFNTQGLRSEYAQAGAKRLGGFVRLRTTPWQCDGGASGLHHHHLVAQASGLFR